MCTHLPSLWTLGASISSVMCSGATPTQAVCLRLCRQHVWWVHFSFFCCEIMLYMLFYCVTLHEWILTGFVFKRIVVFFPSNPFLPSSAAVSEVSGGTAALPTCWLLLCTLSGLCDPAGDHQRETWRPVAHRHSENQETAVRTPPAMTITSGHSTPDPPPDPELMPGCHSHTIATTTCNQYQPW